MAARRLMAMPPKLPKAWSEAEVDPDTESAYHDLLDKLRGLEFDAHPDRGRGPHVLKLSADGKAAWVAYYDAWAKEQSAVEGELAAAYSKLEGYAARLALLHHVSPTSPLWATQPVGPSVAARVKQTIGSQPKPAHLRPWPSRRRARSGDWSNSLGPWGRIRSGPDAGQLPAVPGR